MNSLLTQKNVNVKWTGEKFEPKAVDLYRVNTKRLGMSNNLNYLRVVTETFPITDRIEIRPELGSYEDIPYLLSYIQKFENLTNERFSNTNVNSWKSFIMSLYYDVNFGGKLKR